MIGSISGLGAYSYYNVYRPQGLQNSLGAAGQSDTQGIQNTQRPSVTLAAHRAASPETPIQPVSPVSVVRPDRTQPVTWGPVLRMGADPAEMAVRMRIQPYNEAASQSPPPSETIKSAANSLSENGAADPTVEGLGADGAQKAIEDGQCETCEERKYQDGSDDMGVSFQSPTRVDPDLAASAVRGHENEHVVREQAKAQREDRKVVSQSVTLHSDICPECGKVYISGGTTRTTTAANQEEQETAVMQASNAEQQRKPFSVLA